MSPGELQSLLLEKEITPNLQHHKWKTGLLDEQDSKTDLLAIFVLKGSFGLP
jgi:hypothetical protein